MRFRLLVCSHPRSKPEIRRESHTWSELRCSNLEAPGTSLDCSATTWFSESGEVAPFGIGGAFG